MLKMAAVLVLALGLSACDAVNTVTEGMNHARAVETALEGAVGVRPQVGFNWHNGRLVQVTVSFPRLVDAKPLRDLAGLARDAVSKEFKQRPDQIMLAFAVGS
jgi:hypothetical protein